MGDIVKKNKNPDKSPSRARKSATRRCGARSRRKEGDEGWANGGWGRKGWISFKLASFVMEDIYITCSWEN